MRHLYLLRGNVGCGKSHWLATEGLTPYTLCADDIRLQLQSPILTTKGVLAISPENDRKVWQLLFEMLETRMGRGELVFIDATHSKGSDFAKYKNLAGEYRYRIFCIDFSDVPLETCKIQNKARAEYKWVPEHVLDNLDARIKSQPVPGYVQVVKPHEYNTVFDYTPLDLSHYKAIHVIGDIHGCYEPLKQWFEQNGYCEDHYYIFIGDYIDRGIQNTEVVRWLVENYTKPNILLLEGNHERWLKHWAHGEIVSIRSNEFLFQTMKELDASNLDKGEIRQLCRKFAQIAYFYYGSRLLLVNHAGISKLPDDLGLITIATEQFIKGVGKYEDMLEVAESWMQNSPTNAIQIAGHRNVTKSPTMINPKYYNLQGDIEFGENLRVVTLTLLTDEIVVQEVKNTVFRPKNIKVETTLGSDSFVQQLRSNRYITERPYGDISSFNFTRNAFYKKVWDGMTVKARGLFINTKTNEIVARSYNKFFNVNEQEDTKIGTVKLEYPVNVFDKYNGFLGMIGYDTASDQLLFTSKSSIEGIYPDMFKRTWALAKPNVGLEAIKQELKEKNISLVFEVINQETDPHIIEYPMKYAIILLDLVRRTLDYEKLPYEETATFAQRHNLSWKRLRCQIENREQLFRYYNVAQKIKTTAVEGMVFEDSKGFMMKLKLPYYNFWKHMRVVKDALRARRQVNLSGLITPEANYFYAWLKTRTEEELARDIITLRNMYYKEKGT